MIDPSEAKPVLDFLKKFNMTLKLIINTHHHHDHVGGNLDLRLRFPFVEIGCSERDAQRIPGANRFFKNQVLESVVDLEFYVYAIPGHTQGQIAIYIPSLGGQQSGHQSDHQTEHQTEHHAKTELGALFAGDTVFAMGCGRLLEGTAEQMWTSLQFIKKLPPLTLLYFGHEYTERNGTFTLNAQPGNATAITERLIEARTALAKNEFPRVPTLEEEMQVNPFFLAKDFTEFKSLRIARDSW